MDAVRRARAAPGARERGASGAGAGKGPRWDGGTGRIVIVKPILTVSYSLDPRGSGLLFFMCMGPARTLARTPGRTPGGEALRAEVCTSCFDDACRQVLGNPWRGGAAAASWRYRERIGIGSSNSYINCPYMTRAPRTGLGPGNRIRKYINR